MDPYKKMTEAGVFLHQFKRNELAIKVLRAAQELETNQLGITMKLQLTLANVYASLRETDLAIVLYQDCLNNAVASHDSHYQTKALVSMASLQLDSGNTYQAIVYYEKMLQLQIELRGGEEGSTPLPDFWTKDLDCALHLNLSIAYKTIGNMISAEKAAKKYLQLVDWKTDSEERAESYCNVGMLNEIIGNYQEALEYYLKYREVSKEQGNKRHLAQAYGCLGCVYGALHNWKLSITYHEQCINMANQLDDVKLLSNSFEQLGNTYMLKEDYDKAVTSFKNMTGLLPKKDASRTAHGLCKVGHAFRLANRHQYALYFYEHAYGIAEELSLTEVLEACEFNMAVILQSSTQITEIEKALKYYERLIPAFERKVHQLLEEGAHVPREIENQISDCYAGIQYVLAKLGNKEEGLQYAETCHRRILLKVKTSQPLSTSWTNVSSSHNGVSNWWHMDKINHVVNSQNATILCYSIIPSNILLWVLQPGSGLVRFYAGKPPSDTDMHSYLRSLTEEIQAKKRFSEQKYLTENRSLPQRNIELKLARDKNLTLSKEAKTKQIRHSIEKEQSLGETQSRLKLKSAQRLLYDCLLAPVEDILEKLEHESPLVVIPDEELFELPFGMIQDFRGRLMKDRFRLTYIPSLYLVDKVTTNELDQLRIQDDLEFERVNTRLGGLTRLLTGHERLKTVHNLDECESEMDNASQASSNISRSEPKQVSNPRLLKSGRLSALTNTHTSYQHEGIFLALTSKFTKLSSREKTASSVMLPHTPKSLNPLSRSLPGPPGGQHTGTSLERMLGADAMSTLVSRTATGTDVVQCVKNVTEFKQISDPQNCVVFGNPNLPEKVMLRGKEWKPPCELTLSQKEAYKMADILDTEAIVGADATKDVFLNEIQSATIVHIACIASLEEGYLVMSPNSVRQKKGPPSEHEYIVMAGDIMALKLTAKLVVLSCGWSTFSLRECHNRYLLPSAFLAAGAQCVLTVLWTVPNIVTDKFFFHFYESMNENCTVTKASNVAMQKLKEDERFDNMFHWSPFMLIGKDVTIDLSQIRKSQLHQKIDKTEKAVIEMSTKDVLNTKPYVDIFPTREKNMTKLQGIFSLLLAEHEENPHAISELIIVITVCREVVRFISRVDTSLKRQNTHDCEIFADALSDHLHDNKTGLDLLHFVGFHFQPRDGADLRNPYIVYPHWDPDKLLLPTLESLLALTELVRSPACIQAFYELLPTSQNTLASFIDVLCITKHAPEIQLKTSDLTVRPLWHDAKSKALLLSLGFHQIGTLLSLEATPIHRKLVNAALQLFLSVSCYKSNILMHKLDVTLLGPLSDQERESDDRSSDVTRLPSLLPVLLPRHQSLDPREWIQMSTPWSSHIEKTSEMKEKMILANSKTHVSREFKKQIQRSKTWHSSTVAAQANQVLASGSLQKPKPVKVKVKSGYPISQGRVPVDYKPSLTILEVGQRRDYANFTMNERVKNLNERHRDEVRKLYLPYVPNA